MRDNQGKRDDQTDSYERFSAFGFFFIAIIVLILSIFL